jgi:hypothetical protein
MNQRIPPASTGEFFNTIGAKRTFGKLAMSVRGRPTVGISAAADLMRVTLR